MATRLKSEYESAGNSAQHRFLFPADHFQSRDERAGKSVLTCKIHPNFIGRYAGAAARHVRETHELEP